MGANWKDCAINYWPKAYNAGWFGVGGVAILIIFLWIIVRSTGAAHSGFPVNTRRNADLFTGGVTGFGPTGSLLTTGVHA